jgi:ATP-dependent DNA ligase
MNPVGTRKADNRTLSAIAIRLDAMAWRLPSPMLARSVTIPTGDYAFELKWDGARGAPALA